MDIGHVVDRLMLDDEHDFAVLACLVLGLSNVISFLLLSFADAMELFVVHGVKAEALFCGVLSWSVSSKDSESRKVVVEDNVEEGLEANAIKCLQARSQDIFLPYLIGRSYQPTGIWARCPITKCLAPYLAAMQALSPCC